MKQYIYVQSHTLPGTHGREVYLGKVLDTPANRVGLVREFNCSISKPSPGSQYTICEVYSCKPGIHAQTK